MSIFKSITANKWVQEAKTQAIPNQLFGEFWFENEISILFADTNLGKSILAVQIANSISKGIPIDGFSLQAEKQKVLYFDFELSKKQFENRYSDNYHNHYYFDDNLVRSEINLEDGCLKEEKIIEHLINEIEFQNAKVVIIDNLTFLISDIEKSTIAQQFMKKLKSAKKELDLSILILAHTPKRDFVRPISNNDLQGSKMLMNFADSSFAVGKSYKDTNIRYIKQIKQRNCEQVYTESNIPLFTINKGLNNNFLQFEFVEFGNESEHLNHSKTDYEESLERTKHLKEQGINNVEIGKILGISESTVRKRLNKQLV